MGRVGGIIAGMGILIGIYLFLARGGETVGIITALGKQTTNSVRVLQGR